MTPAIFALVLHLAYGDVTVSNYYEYRNCTTARDAIKESRLPGSANIECKMIKFDDVIYEDGK